MTAEQPKSDVDRLMEGLGRFLDCHDYLDVEVVCDGDYRVQAIWPNKSQSSDKSPPPAHS
jgi:hypothetical protein